MAHPYDETLGFSALMITAKQGKNLDHATLINVTHSNINTSDISSKILQSTFYRHTEHSATNKSIASVNSL